MHTNLGTDLLENKNQFIQILEQQTLIHHNLEWVSITVLLAGSQGSRVESKGMGVDLETFQGEVILNGSPNGDGISQRRKPILESGCQTLHESRQSCVHAKSHRWLSAPSLTVTRLSGKGRSSKNSLYLLYKPVYIHYINIYKITFMSVIKVPVTMEKERI